MYKLESGQDLKFRLGIENKVQLESLINLTHMIFQKVCKIFFAKLLKFADFTLNHTFMKICILNEGAFGASIWKAALTKCQERYVLKVYFGRATKLCRES